MPSGGHSRSGPAPDPTSFRSAAAGSSGGWTRMETPPDTPPAWPMGTPTEAESAEWASLWTRPAASLWERFGLVNDVAVHVRTLIAFAANGYANAALGGLVARQADNLGITVAGAARNRWSWPTTTAAGPPNRAALIPITGGGSGRSSLMRERLNGSRGRSTRPDTTETANAATEETDSA